MYIVQYIQAGSYQAYRAARRLESICSRVPTDDLEVDTIIWERKRFYEYTCSRNHTMKLHEWHSDNKWPVARLFQAESH